MKTRMNHSKWVKLFYESGLTASDFKNERVAMIFMGDEEIPVIITPDLSKYDNLIVCPPGMDHYGWEGEDEWNTIMADLAELTGEVICNMDMVLCA